jgi:hypothetical protein
VLVEPLAGPDAEGEAALGKQCGRGRRLRHHGRMVTDEWTGDAGGKLDVLGTHSRGCED